MVVLGTAGRGSEMEILQSISKTQRWLESKEYQRCLRSELEKLQDIFRVENRSSPDRWWLGIRKCGNFFKLRHTIYMYIFVCTKK